MGDVALIVGDMPRVNIVALRLYVACDPLSILMQNTSFLNIYRIISWQFEVSAITSALFFKLEGICVEDIHTFGIFHIYSSVQRSKSLVYELVQPLIPH